MILFRSAILFLALALMSSSAFAYTLFLKDGSQLICKSKYTIEGDRALVVLESGQTTAFHLSDIDVARSDEFNRTSSGNAFVIDGGPLKAVPRSDPNASDRDLGDLIRERRANKPDTSIRPPTRRQQQTLRKTQAGFLDFSSLQRRPLQQRDASEALDLALRKFGVDGPKIFEGTEDGAVFVEVITDTREAAFSALEGVAKTMQSLGPVYNLSTFQLLMQTSVRGRAGQFVLNSRDAAAIANGTVAINKYYLDNVQY